MNKLKVDPTKVRVSIRKELQEWRASVTSIVGVKMGAWALDTVPEKAVHRALRIAAKLGMPGIT